MTEPDMKSLSRGLSRDMSPDAVLRRLEIASELRDLAMTLAAGQRLGKKETSPEVVEQDASLRDAGSRMA